jgi:hypothetical protein
MCQTVTARMPVPHIELKIRNKLTTQLLMLSRESGVETSINRPYLIDCISQQVSNQGSKQANVKKSFVSFSLTFFFGVTEWQNFAKKKSWFC